MRHRPLHALLWTVLSISLALAAPATPLVGQARALQAAPINEYNAVNHPVVGRNGMVASQNAAATRVGVEILRNGGNAVDAAVAVGLALAVTVPRAGNIGGGGFMLVHLADEDRTVAIDFRETAPAAAHRDMYFGADGEVDESEYRFSHKSSAVPGTVAGLDHILRNYGTMEWADVVEPALRLARDGIVVTDDLANNLGASRSRLTNNPAAAAAFYKPDGSEYQVGEILRQPDLAWSLEQLRSGGADAFYHGAIADRIVADMEAHNGLITHEDLASYRVVEREPVDGTYNGFDIRAMSAPSSGGMHIVQMLNILERFPISDMGYGSADAMHVMAEAMKLAYADRSKYLGDPDHVELPEEQLTSKAYAKDLAESIDPTRARPSSEIGPGDLTAYESPETTHYSVMDSEGNAVVNTYTLMFSYGSGVVIDGAGFLMNNNMGNFTLRPDIPDAFGLMGSADNQITAGRRPVSSMTPIIVLREGVPYLLTGSPGGSRIITTNLQLLVNVLGHEMNIADATVVPRLHHQWQPDRLEVESGFSPDALRILIERGHDVQAGRAMGSLQTVLFDGEWFYGFSDPRRPGALSLGYNATPQTPGGSWEVRADIPYRVQEIYPALHQGRIYLAGGLSPDVDPDDQGISDRVYIYDPAADQWRQGPSLPGPRHHPYLVSSGSELFSIGGFVAANGGRWSASTDILRLDETTDSWVKVADLLAPQSETVAGYIDGKIYIASGRAPNVPVNADWDHQGDVDALQIFDPATLTVSWGPAASVRRNSAAGAVIDGKLYVVGGRVVNGGNLVANEVFDPATGEWTTLAPMPNAQGGIAAAALNGRLYVFGGEFFGAGGSGVHRESWVYDPTHDTWSPIAEMPVPRHGLGAVTIGDEVFVVAGASQAGGAGTTNRLSVFVP